MTQGMRDLPMSRIGFGAAEIAGLYRPETEATAQATLHTAWDAGIRYFDTAPHYGVGLSEERLGRFLTGVPRNEFTVSSKVGRLLVPGTAPDGTEGFYGTPDRIRVRDYSRDGVVRSVEESCKRLGLDRIDVLYVHDPDDTEAHEQQALDEAYPALAELRAQGVVSAIGVAMNTVRVPARFVRETDIDCVLIAGRYTLLDRTAADELLPLCVERGVAVVAAGVFNSGLLVTPEPGATYDYAAAPPELLARARRMSAVCARHGTTIGAAAIAFVLRHPAVRTALLGMRAPAEVLENVAGSVPDALWAEL